MNDTALRELRRALARYRADFTVRLIARRVCTAATVAAVVLALLGIAFWLFPWTVLPLAWDTAIVLTVLVAVAVLVDCLWLRPISLHHTAAMLEHRAAVEHPLLSTALQLGERTDHGFSSALTHEVIRRANVSLDDYPRRIDGVLKPRRAAVAGIAVAVCAAASLLPSPSIGSYWDLPLSLSSRDGSVFPGSIVVPTRSSVTVRLVPGSRTFPSCRLDMWSARGERPTTRVIRADSAGGFRYTVDSLQHTLFYRFSLSGRSFDPETISVVPPPVLYSLRVSLTPPRYTGAPSRALPEGQGNLSAYAGTRVKLEAESMHALDSARLLYGGDTLEMDVDGKGAAIEFAVRRGGSYTFELTDALGQSSESPPTYQIETIPDEAPFVHFLRPAADRALTPALRESLLVEAIDDIGVRALELHWIVSGRDSAEHQVLVRPKRRSPAVRVGYDWDLSPVGLYPGDTLYYWARVQDNKPFGTPGTAISDTFWFRVPGFEEIHRQIASRSDHAQETLEQVREQQEKLRDQLTDMVRSASGKQQLSWEEKKLVEDVQKQIESQRDSLAMAVEELREAVEAMKEEGEIGEEIARKMEEVREAIEDLVQEYGDSLLFDLNKKEQGDIDAREMAEALERMKQMLPDLEQRLEQALKYLQMLQRDQQLAALAQRFEKMAEHQQHVCDIADSAQQAARQKDVLDAIDKLSSEAKQRMQPGEQQLLDPSSTPSLQRTDSLSRAMQSMNNAPRGECSRAGNQMSASLLSTAQEIANQMSSAMMERMMAERERLLDLAHDAITLAEWQKEQVEAAERSADVPSLVRSQQALLEAAGKVSGKLDSLSMVPPRMMAQVVENLDGAAEAMREAQRSMAENGSLAPMAQAAANMSGAAQALLAAGDGMMSGQGAGGGAPGFTGMMRKLSGRQAAINAATGELLRQMLQMGQGQGQGQGRNQKPGGQQPGGTQPGGGSEALAQAREQARKAQQALAEQLKKLAEQYGDEAGPGGKDRTKQLEQEARRLARMLENPTSELRERQDRFLARMLQTTLSLHREGEGKEKRQSQSASRTFAREQVVAPGMHFADTDTYYRLRQKAFESNIPPRYRTAVKAYFDSLGVLYLRNE